MISRVCLVHYHEVGLKKRNRAHFERILISNLKFALSDLPIRDVERISGHILVTFIDDEALFDAFSIIKQIPGVARVSAAWLSSQEESEYMKCAKLALESAGSFESFKVHARRSNTQFSKNSMELNQEIGGHLHELFPDKKVIMKNPDVTVVVLVSQNSVFTYVTSEPGVGGLPVYTGGTMVALFSSGFDSPVATWKMIRRGAVVIPVHFSGRPQTSSVSEYQVDELIKQFKPTAGIPRAYIVPFGSIQKLIALKTPASLRVIMYRRMMFVIAEKVAQAEGAKALITGESLGQVASQTIENIRATNEVATLPIFQPLIGSDKQEIIALAQDIGTHDISIQDAEDCCTLFMPKNPETHASLDEVNKIWKTLPIDEYVKQALDNIEVIEYPSPYAREKIGIDSATIWQGSTEVI